MSKEYIITCSDEQRPDGSYAVEDCRELVRCKDCKWHTGDNDCTNPQWDSEDRIVYPCTKEIDYCSFGERKEQEDE